MTASKSSARKSTRKKTSKSARERARAALDESLRDLERQLPKNMRGPIGDLRTGIRSLQKQIDKARSEREERWERLENQIRRDAASLFRRLEKAVEPKKKKKRKASAKKKAARKAAVEQAAAG